MKSFQHKVAVITGAGSGIGRELAVQLSGRGAAVAIQDINKKGLEETADIIRRAGGDASTHVFDIADKKKVRAFPNAVIKQHRQVDIVINNAGVSFFGEIMDMKDEDFDWIMNINCWGMFHMSRAFLPHLLLRPHANLVNVSSVFGLVSTAFNSAYCMSKFAIRAFTECLRQELAGSPVQVTLVCPGGIKTNIGNNPRTTGKYSREQLDEMSKRFYDDCKTTAAQAAQTIISAIASDRPRVLVGFDAKLLNTLGFLFPGKIDGMVLNESKKKFGLEPTAFAQYLKGR